VQPPEGRRSREACARLPGMSRRGDSSSSAGPIAWIRSGRPASRLRVQCWKGRSARTSFVGPRPMFLPMGDELFAPGTRDSRARGARPYVDGRAPRRGAVRDPLLRPVGSSGRFSSGPERTRVVAVSRDATTKRTCRRLRAVPQAVRVLAESAGRETIHEADVVLDATGRTDARVRSQRGHPGRASETRPGSSIANSDLAAPGSPPASPPKNFTDRSRPLRRHDGDPLAAFARRHPRTRILWAFRGRGSLCIRASR